MRHPKLSKLEMQIMDVLWSAGPSAIREIQESFGAKNRPAYTTVQTMVYRLEAKKALRRARKIGNAHIFEAVISRDTAQRLLGLQPVHHGLHRGVGGTALGPETFLDIADGGGAVVPQHLHDLEFQLG